MLIEFLKFLLKSLGLLGWTASLTPQRSMYCAVQKISTEVFFQHESDILSASKLRVVVPSFQGSVAYRTSTVVCVGKRMRWKEVLGGTMLENFT